MTRKIIKVGTSTGVTIPKEVVEDFNLKPGDEVEVFVDKENKVVSLKPKEKDDKEFKVWMNEFMDEYGETLKKLAEN